MKKVQILGMGCSKCKLLTKNVEAAARELGIEIEIEKVTDIMEITKAGVMMTPALVVDGKLKASGKILTVSEAAAVLED